MAANKGATLALKTGEGFAYGAAVGGIITVVQNIAVAVFGTVIPGWLPLVIGGAVFAGITLEGLENFFSQ
jgi:hypothetical protein